MFDFPFEKQHRVRSIVSQKGEYFQNINNNINEDAESRKTTTNRGESWNTITVNTMCFQNNLIKKHLNIFTE